MSLVVSKAIRIAEKQRLIHGISEDDPYFRYLADDTEMEFVNICRRCIPLDAVCFDIGANIGVKALALSEIAPNGRVYSFEPAPTVYPILVSNIAENGCRNVDTKQIALSNTDGEVLFHDNSAYGHIVTTNGVRVPALNLTTIVNSMGLDRLDFIKIDTEGFEFKILKSGYEVIKKFKSVVYFEFNTWTLIAHSRTDPVEFLEWIFDNFLCVAKVNRSRDEPLTPLTRQDLLKFLYANMLDDSCVSDLVVTTRMPRFWPGSARAVLETYHTHNDAHAVLHEQADATLPVQRGRLSSLRRVFRFLMSVILTQDNADAPTQANGYRVYASRLCHSRRRPDNGTTPFQLIAIGCRPGPWLNLTCRSTVAPSDLDSMSRTCPAMCPRKPLSVRKMGASKSGLCSRNLCRVPCSWPAMSPATANLKERFSPSTSSMRRLPKILCIKRVNLD
jgi:FkbM family methyltransferase